MEQYMQMLEYIGMERIIYGGRGISMSTTNAGYHNRGAIYRAITESHMWSKSVPISNLVMQYGLGDIAPEFMGIDIDSLEFPTLIDEPSGSVLIS
jgi:hypothetical protein